MINGTVLYIELMCSVQSQVDQLFQVQKEMFTESGCDASEFGWQNHWRKNSVFSRTVYMMARIVTLQHGTYTRLGGTVTVHVYRFNYWRVPKTYEWMKGWLAGWLAGWLDRWMGGCRERHETEIQTEIMRQAIINRPRGSIHPPQE